MTSPKETIQQASELLLKLERAIESKSVTEANLESAQKKLDEFDRELKSASYRDGEIHILSEIQTLIYGQQNQDEKANDWLQESIRIAGSPENLSSKLLREYAISAKPLYVPFVHRSQISIFILSFFTLGIYFLVWFYKNWNALKLSKGEKMWPFWRAVFSVFWAWPLFVGIKEYAESRGQEIRMPSAGLLAFFYAIPLIASNAISKIPDEQFNGGWWTTMIILLIVSTLSIMQVQKTINSIPDISDEERKHENRWTIGQIIVIIIGFILFLLATVGWFSDPTTFVDTPESSAKMQEAESLLADYNACVGELESLEATIDNTSQLSVDTYNQKYDSCEAIRVSQNEAADQYNKMTGQNQ